MSEAVSSPESPIASAVHPSAFATSTPHSEAPATGATVSSESNPSEVNSVQSQKSNSQSQDRPAEAAPAPPAEVQLELPVNEPSPQPSIARETLRLAAQDVRTVIQEQNKQSQILTTKLNILFVANGALLTSLSISELLISGGLLGLAEALGFLVSFSLLMSAFLPRQVAVTPNLQDQKFLETYLLLAPKDYELQMLVNLSEACKANKQRLDDVSQSLKYAAYTIWSTAAIMLVHIVVAHMPSNPFSGT